MLPEGWTVEDSIPYTIISENPSLNNTGFLIYDPVHSKTLKDSIPAMPGYYWWGAITDRIAELTSLDSFYFAPRIITMVRQAPFSSAMLWATKTIGTGILPTVTIMAEGCLILSASASAAMSGGGTAQQG
jgi:hypothetical protein